MYKFHHRFYRDVKPFRDTVPFPKKLQCIMMIKVISALENGKTCHRYYSHSPLSQKKLYKEHYRYNCNLYFKVNKKKTLHICIRFTIIILFLTSDVKDGGGGWGGGGQLLLVEWELCREKIHKNEISLSDTQNIEKFLLSLIKC